MNPSDPLISRLDELLADQALEGLAPDQLSELRDLAPTQPATFDSLELAAAEAAVAWSSPTALPVALRAKLEDLATEFIAQKTADRRRVDPASPPGERRRYPARRMPVAGWVVIAAGLVLGAVGWITRIPSAEPPPATARASLLANAKDAIQWAWSSWTKEADPCAKGVTGDVVWCPSSRKGYLRFCGLPPNDPAKHVYQLWIIDSTRPGEPPIDGGVFNVTASKETIVPICAKLHVGKAAAFAITVEKPEGAVVSKQERRVVIAEPSER